MNRNRLGRIRKTRTCVPSIAFGMAVVGASGTFATEMESKWTDAHAHAHAHVQKNKLFSWNGNCQVVGWEFEGHENDNDNDEYEYEYEYELDDFFDDPDDADGGMLEGWSLPSSASAGMELYGGADGTMRVVASLCSRTGRNGSTANDGDHDHDHGRYCWIESPPLSLSFGTRNEYEKNNDNEYDDHNNDWPSVVLRYRIVGDGGRHTGWIRWRDDEYQNDNGQCEYPHHTYTSTYTFRLELPFEVTQDGRWHIAYAHPNDGRLVTNHFQGGETTASKTTTSRPTTIFHLSRIELWPWGSEEDERFARDTTATVGRSFHVDWIRLVRKPSIERVTGCRSSSTGSPSTYDCVRAGGDLLVVHGRNLWSGDGAPPAHVTVGGRPCREVVHDGDRRLTCRTPPYVSSPSSSDDDDGVRIVRVRNGKLPGLMDEVPWFRYAVPPPPIRTLEVNVDVDVDGVAARSVDIRWEPGGSVVEASTYTGYRIRWTKRDNDKESRRNVDGGDMVVDNVTSTTVRPLDPDTSYIIVVTGLTEHSPATLSMPHRSRDVYGRRWNDAEALQMGASPDALEGPPPSHPLVVHTKALDVNLNVNVNKTVSSAGVATQMDLVGDALVVADPVGTGAASFVRLTKSAAHLRGAAWHSTPLDVSEGFDTEFVIRITPGDDARCRNMEGVYDRCRSRGADGLAFVIQNVGKDFVGAYGSHMGYGSDTANPNSSNRNRVVAVEFDTYYNHEEDDPYENHVSVQVEGQSHHHGSLGSTAAVPDLADGEPLRVRVRYVPFLDVVSDGEDTLVTSPRLLVSPAGDPNGMGTLRVFVEGRKVLTVLLNVRTALWGSTTTTTPGNPQEHGHGLRPLAWVGFTAATGTGSWQTHDVLEWTFSSLRLDGHKFPVYPPPPPPSSHSTSP